MENLLSLLRRRGFVFASSEIYGGLAGFFDYGPLGCEMKKNIKDAWWKDMVQRRDDVVGLDCSILMNPLVWEASGHLAGFSDPLVDCRQSKMRYRADQLFFAPITAGNDLLGYISLLESENMEEEAQAAAEKMRKKSGAEGPLAKIQLRPYSEATHDEQPLIPSPATGQPGSLTPPRQFNLMFKTHLGAVEDASTEAYLRPETAQGIFVNFKNILDTTHRKLPFGVAQIGRSFRNEITPRNFLFRAREFEQMELEFFFSPNDDWESWYRYWIQERLKWHESIGIRREMLALEEHPANKLAHYSRACSDIVFDYPFGRQELEGIAARGNYDLSCHQEKSGKNLEYFDEENHERFLPQVVEPSVGVDRLFFALLCSAYQEDEVDGEKRTYLRLHPRIAPYKIAILPLLKNKPALMEKAQTLHKTLKQRCSCAFDASGAIGRRYRRMDEIGTPFCLTVDFQTLDDETFTVRDRDTTEQLRMKLPELLDFLAKAQCL